MAALSTSPRVLGGLAAAVAAVTATAVIAAVAVGSSAPVAVTVASGPGEQASWATTATAPPAAELAELAGRFDPHDPVWVDLELTPPAGHDRPGLLVGVLADGAAVAASAVPSARVSSGQLTGQALSRFAAELATFTDGPARAECGSSVTATVTARFASGPVRHVGCVGQDGLVGVVVSVAAELIPAVAAGHNLAAPVVVLAAEPGTALRPD